MESCRTEGEVRDQLPVNFASGFVAIDCGDTIWCLLTTKRPPAGGPAETETNATPERWVAFPRSGFLVSLFGAMEQLVPGAEGTSPGPARSPHCVN